MSHAGFGEKFRAALERRRGLLSDGGTTVGRLFAGDRDGVGGVYVERWGDACTLVTYEGAIELGGLGDVVEMGEVVRSELISAGVWGEGEGGVYWKPFSRERVDGGVTVLTEREPVVGVAVDDEIGVLENGVAYGARLWDGFSCGLFVDQRANRGWLGRWCSDLGREVRDTVKVLNLFAYTGGFGVSAAVQGMWQGVDVETSNVDVSGRYLDWAKRNYERNGVAFDGDGAKNHFVRADARSFVQHATKKGWRFDAIVIDPPTFGSADKRRGIPVWRVEKDLAELVGDACGILSPGGVVLVSSNAASMSEEDRLARAVLKGVGEVGRKLTWVELPAAGVDVVGSGAGDDEEGGGAMGRFSAVAFTV